MEIQRKQIGSVGVLEVSGEAVTRDQASALSQEVDWCRLVRASRVVVDCGALRWVGAAFIGEPLDFRWGILALGVDLWLMGVADRKELALSASGLLHLFQAAESVDSLLYETLEERSNQTLVVA